MKNIIIFLTLLFSAFLKAEEVPPFFKGSEGQNICAGQSFRDSRAFSCSEGLERAGMVAKDFWLFANQVNNSLSVNLRGESGHSCFRAIRSEVQVFLNSQLESMCRSARCALGTNQSREITNRCPSSFTCEAFTHDFMGQSINPQQQLDRTLTKLREQYPRMRRVMALAALNGLDYSDVYGLGRDIPAAAMRHPHNSQGMIRFPELDNLTATETQDVIKEIVRNLDLKNRQKCTDSEFRRWAEHYSGTRVTRKQFPSYKCERRQGSRVLESRNQDSPNVNPIDAIAGWRCQIDASRTVDGPYVYEDRSPNPATRQEQVTTRERGRAMTRTVSRVQPSVGAQFTDEQFSACLARREVTSLIVSPPRTSAQLREAISRSYPLKDETPAGLSLEQVRERYLNRNARGPQTTLKKNPVSDKLNLQTIRQQYEAEYMQLIEGFPLMAYVKTNRESLSRSDLIEPFEKTIKNITNQLDKVGTGPECRGLCTSMIDWDYLMYAPAAARAIADDPGVCCDYAQRVWQGRGVVNTGAAVGLAIASVGGAIGCGVVTAGTAAVACAIGAGTGLAAADALRANEVAGVASAIANTGIAEDIDSSRANYRLVDVANEERDFTVMAAGVSAALDAPLALTVNRIARSSTNLPIDTPSASLATGATDTLVPPVTPSSSSQAYQNFIATGGQPQLFEKPPILAWRIPEDIRSANDIPLAIRERMGSLDQVKYGEGTPYRDLDEYIKAHAGSVMSLQKTNDGRWDIYPIGHDAFSKYTTIPISNFTQQYQDGFSLLGSGEGLTLIQKAGTTELVRASDLGFPVDQEIVFQAEFGLQVKPAGQDAFVNFNNGSPYIVNVDGSNPAGYRPVTSSQPQVTSPSAIQNTLASTDLESLLTSHPLLISKLAEGSVFARNLNIIRQGPNKWAVEDALKNILRHVGEPKYGDLNELIRMIETNDLNIQTLRGWRLAFTDQISLLPVSPALSSQEITRINEDLAANFNRPTTNISNLDDFRSQMLGVTSDHPTDKELWRNQIRSAIDNAPAEVKADLVRVYNDFNSPEFSSYITEISADALVLCRRTGECSSTQVTSVPDLYLEAAIKKRAKELGAPLGIISTGGREADEVFIQRIRQGQTIVDYEVPGDHGTYSHALQNLFLRSRIGQERSNNLFQYLGSNSDATSLYDRMFDINRANTPIPSPKDVFRTMYGSSSEGTFSYNGLTRETSPILENGGYGSVPANIMARQISKDFGKATATPSRLDPSVRVGNRSMVESESSQIRSVLEESRERINALTISSNDTASAISRGTDHIPDASLKNGFRKAAESLADKAKLADYFEKLQVDVFETMLRSGDPALVEKARRGELDDAIMLRVLEHRAATRGISMVTVHQSVSTPEFNRFIGVGMIVDHGFSTTSSHGRFSHLIQQDFTYPIIQQESGKSYQEILNYLGTQNGMMTWDNLYDLSPGNQSPLSPEFFTPRIMRPNLPLGYLFRNKFLNSFEMTA